MLRFIIILALLMSMGCSSNHVSDKLRSIAEEKGADMNFYHLYAQEKDIEKKVQYAEIFLSQINPDTDNPAIARMCDSI